MRALCDPYAVCVIRSPAHPSRLLPASRTSRVIEARAEFHHEWIKLFDIDHLLLKLPGVRIGAGMLKIIKGLVGEEEEARQIGYMVEECCQAVIISLTKDLLAQAPVSEEGKLEFFSQMARDNIRLLNRCAAFAPGSRLVEGAEPPK